MVAKVSGGGRHRVVARVSDVGRQMCDGSVPQTEMTTSSDVGASGLFANGRAGCDCGLHPLQTMQNAKRATIQEEETAVAVAGQRTRFQKKVKRALMRAATFVAYAVPTETTAQQRARTWPSELVSEPEIGGTVG